MPRPRKEWQATSAPAPSVAHTPYFKLRDSLREVGVSHNIVRKLVERGELSAVQFAEGIRATQFVSRAEFDSLWAMKAKS